MNKGLNSVNSDFLALNSQILAYVRGVSLNNDNTLATELPKQNSEAIGHKFSTYYKTCFTIITYNTIYYIYNT